MRFSTVFSVFTCGAMALAAAIAPEALVRRQGGDEITGLAIVAAGEAIVAEAVGGVLGTSGGVTKRDNAGILGEVSKMKATTDALFVSLGRSFSSLDSTRS